MINMGLTSVAEIYKYIKQFHFSHGFNHDPFAELTYSNTDHLRFDLDESAILLKYDNSLAYPKYFSAADMWVRTWTTNPLACRKLLMLELFPEVQPNGAELYLRLYNGSDDYYWDGAAWSIAGAGDWNTEGEINANIDTFPILPDRVFAVTVNFRSVVDADSGLVAGDVTPILTEIRVLMEVHIDFLEDIILRTLLPDMESKVTAVSNFAAITPYSTNVSEIDFSEYRVNTPFNIIDIERVYDLTDDIDLLYNLFDSYNSGTGVITISPDLPAGNVPMVVFRYRPEVVFIQHQDYMEVAKLPCLILQKVDVPVAGSYSKVTTREGVVDKGTGNAVVVENPFRSTIEFKLHGLTTSVVDELRLQSRVLQWTQENQFIRSTGLDEYYRMYLEKEFRDLSQPGRADERAFWTKLSIHDVRMPFISKDEKAVTKLAMTFKEPKPPHEDPVKGGTRTVISFHTDGGPVTFTETVEKT